MNYLVLFLGGLLVLAEILLFILVASIVVVWKVGVWAVKKLVKLVWR